MPKKGKTTQNFGFCTVLPPKKVHFFNCFRKAMVITGTSYVETLFPNCLVSTPWLFE